MGELYSVIMLYDNMHPSKVMHTEYTQPINQRELLD